MDSARRLGTRPPCHLPGRATPPPRNDYANLVTRWEMVRRDRLSDLSDVEPMLQSKDSKAREGVSSVRAQYFRFASAVVAVVTLVTVGGAGWKFV